MITLRNYITMCITWDYIPGLYYGIAQRDYLAEVYHRTILRVYSTELYSGIRLRNYIANIYIYIYIVQDRITDTHFGIMI